METTKRSKSIQTIIEGLLQRYFGYGKKDLARINIDEDSEDPCFECLLVSSCHTQCGQKAAHKMLEYLNSSNINPNSCAIVTSQNKKTKELIIVERMRII